MEQVEKVLPILKRVIQFYQSLREEYLIVEKMLLKL